MYLHWVSVLSVRWMEPSPWATLSQVGEDPTILQPQLFAGSQQPGHQVSEAQVGPELTVLSS